jgi:hypothetical protein
MNNDRFGRTPEEQIDEARHFYAVGTVRLRAIADELSEIAQKREGMSLLELKLLHARLFDVYALIGCQTVFEMDNEDDVPTAAYQDNYSDGTPVSIVVGPASSRGWSLPDDVYDCEIPWLPNTTGNDPYVGEGPTPPGCELVVVDPPHRRKSNTRAGWQEAYSDVKALKSRLVETQR